MQQLLQLQQLLELASQVTAPAPCLLLLTDRLLQECQDELGSCDHSSAIKLGVAAAVQQVVDPVVLQVRQCRPGEAWQAMRQAGLLPT